MREFKCERLGNNCTWKHIAKTEELLAYTVAMHLREVHGITEVSPDMEGKIKNLFTYPTTADAAGSADIVMKEYNCDMDPECAWRYVAMTEDLITKGAAVHAKEAHGIEKFTRQMKEKVTKSTHEWKEGTKKGGKAA